MSNIINKFLEQWQDEVEPVEFYRSIFPEGELEEKGIQVEGKYNAVAVELLEAPEGKTQARRHLIHNGLEKLPELLESDNFIIISPISYAGKTRESKNARYIYAIAIDVDGITTEAQLLELFEQFKYNDILTPTYIVSSGNGIHLYYQLTKPLPCYDHIAKQLTKLKNQMTYLIWNKYITELHQNIQYQSVFQGFRMVGGVTKNGDRVRAFQVGDKVTVEQLNDFVRADKYKLLNYTYKSDLSLTEAKEKYPEWYERRIVQKQPVGRWTNKRALFNWWIKQVHTQAKKGHRYFCVMCLAVYAKKCDIPFEELEEIAYSFVEELDNLTEEENNHFTRQDVLSALEAYNDSYIRFPIETISKITDIKIDKNRRNGRKQAAHLVYARGIKELKRNLGELKTGGGMPSKRDIVVEWHAANPFALQADCVKALGINKNTVSKYWHEK